MSQQKSQFDVCIIGAGIVGLTAAIALARKGYNVAISHAFTLESKAISSNALNVRSIALSLSSKQILQNFGCWPQLKTYSQAITDIQVSSQGHWGVTRLNHQQHHCEALGYVIESHHLEAQLITQLKSYNNITIFENTQCEQLENNDDLCHLAFKGKTTTINTSTALCLICDGAQSHARELAGFSTQSFDYRQTAIAAHVSGQHMNQHIAYERFTPQGPLAMLPLTQSRYGLVWTNSQSRSDELMAMNDADFLQALQQNFGYRLGKINQIGQRHAFPLIKTISDQLVQKHCVVLGNAAHNLHPVAGQSLNLAVRDIAHLIDALAGDAPIADALSSYQNLRQTDHQQVIKLGDQLVNIFSNNLPLLNHARSAALALLDVVPTVKNDFAWRAMGFAQTAASAQRG